LISSLHKNKMGELSTMCFDNQKVFVNLYLYSAQIYWWLLKVLESLQRTNLARFYNCQDLKNHYSRVQQELK